MWIDVTEEHIKNGVPEDECNCPIALIISPNSLVNLYPSTIGSLASCPI